MTENRHAPTQILRLHSNLEMAATRRSLHYVLKIGDRTAMVKFLREVLGMKVLRHEEFTEGCKATCNGPYDGKWSKSMVGYGPEDDHFVIELTYNYGIKSYQRGNDYHCMSIFSGPSYIRVKEGAWPYTEEEDGGFRIEAPGGYPFIVYDKLSKTKDPVQSVCLNVKTLNTSIDFWCRFLKMKLLYNSILKSMFGYSEDQAKLVLRRSSSPIDHAESYGRIAFSCPRTELPGIEQSAKEAGYKILTPLVSLDTPGKATVEVVILADPDGHEICFVGDEGFRELSKVDPAADKLIDEAMANDKSAEWFAKHNPS